jgi:nitroreductase
MNRVMEAMETRRSVRAYRPDAVPQDAIERICRAGTYAPTGMGQQSPIIIAVTNKEMRDKLSEMNRKVMGIDADPFYGAPAVLVVLVPKDCATGVFDGSLVMGNLLLAAHAEGLGSCWIHRAEQEFASEEGKAILKELGIEGDYVGIGHCIVGYPACDLPEPAPRKENYVYYVK